jgi:hypothetical protein
VGLRREVVCFWSLMIVQGGAAIGDQRAQTSSTRVKFWVRVNCSGAIFERSALTPAEADLHALYQNSLMLDAAATCLGTIC